MSAKTRPYLKGIINQFKRLKKKTATGVAKKIIKLAFVGKIVSLQNNFNPSAIGWVKPKKPIVLGPKRLWLDPITLRSTNVK